jgi:hypothetical protein
LPPSSSRKRARAWCGVEARSREEFIRFLVSASSRILARPFTVTKPMFERLASLDERSFLSKPFWKRLMKARGKTQRD